MNFCPPTSTHLKKIASLHSKHDQCQLFSKGAAQPLNLDSCAQKFVHLVLSFEMPDWHSKHLGKIRADLQVKYVVE